MNPIAKVNSLVCYIIFNVLVKPLNARNGFKSHPLPANSVTIVLENA